MSQIVEVAQFDPSTSNSTSFSAPNSSPNGVLVFFNESNISIDLTFADNSSMYLPAWYHRAKCGATGDVNISWTIHTTLSSGSPPISEVVVEAFAPGEKYPADGPLVRQTNIGNSIPVSTSSTSIQNDGNAAATSIVEATVSGDPGSAVSWTNSAVLINGNANHPGSVSFDNGTITSNGAGVLTLVQALLTKGSISRISISGPFTVGTGGTSCAHGLGAVPDFVLAVNDAGSAQTNSFAVNFGTMSTTNVTVYATQAGTRTRLIAIKL